uniref:metallophosphoesterase n=1 Tax=Desulfurobacterium sp. TaxID=2004706 RepID=UPI002631620E
MARNLKGLKIEEKDYEILKKLKMPFYIIPGNHDKRTTLLSAFGQVSCPAESENFLNFVLDDYEVRLIGIDSTIPDKPGGEMCADRLAWLEKQLAEEREKPTVIFMHHSPVKFGVPESDVDGFIGADSL